MSRMLTLLLFVSSICCAQSFTDGFDQECDVSAVRSNLGITISPPQGSSDLILKPAIDLPVYKGVPIAGRLIGQRGTPPYAYAIVDGSLPTGVSLNPANGFLSGTPTVVGLYSFIAEVQDAALGAYKCTLSIRVNTPLFVIAADPTPAEVSVLYRYNLMVGGNIGPLRWTNVGSLPDGIVLGGQGLLNNFLTQIVTTLTGAVTISGSNYRVPVVDGSQFANGEWLDVYDVGPANAFFGHVVSGGGTNTLLLDMASAVVYAGTPTSITSGFCQSEIGGMVYGTPTLAGQTIATVRATDTTTGDFIDIPLLLTVVPHGVATFDNTISPGPGGYGGTFLPPVHLGVPYRATVTVADGVPPFSFFDNGGTVSAAGPFSVDSTTGEITGTITDPSLINDYSSAVLVEVGAIDALGSNVTVAQAALVITSSAVNIDGTLSSNSDQLIPSQKAVKAYVDAHSGGGATTAIITASGTLTATKTRYATNNNIAGTAPASPADFTDRYVQIETALTGCSFVAGAGDTVNGGASFSFDITPCYFHFIYNDATNNWFVGEYRIGSI